MDEKILIAGGTGLLGGTLAKQFVNQGQSVRATYCHSQPDRTINASWVHADFTQSHACHAATQGIESAIFCAGQTSGIAQTMSSPTSSLLPNLKMISELLEAAAHNGVKRIILCSSATIYQPFNQPITEDALDLNQMPHEAYHGVGSMHRYVEQLATFYAKTYHFDLLIARISNIYGPRDCFDPPRSHVIPSLIRRAVERETPFTVWGRGNTVRDFIYVDDLANDLIALLNKSWQMEIVNIGGVEPISVKELVPLILNACDHRTSITFDPDRPEGIPYRALDCSRLHALLHGLNRTPLQQGIQQTVDWYIANNTLFDIVNKDIA